MDEARRTCREEEREKRWAEGGAALGPPMLGSPGEGPCGDQALVDSGYMSATAVADAKKVKDELEEAMGWN